MSVWRVIYISIVVRHLFPLLCVKQCNADVSTFHCVSLHTETHFVETDSVWRVIEGRWCFGSGIRIRYPDHHQNLMEWSLGSWLPSRNILFKSVNNFLSNPANRQTDKQTNRQTDKQTNRQTDRQTDKQGWIHNIRPTTLANVTRPTDSLTLWHADPLTHFPAHLIPTQQEWEYLQTRQLTTYFHITCNYKFTRYVLVLNTAVMCYRENIYIYIYHLFSPGQTMRRNRSHGLAQILSHWIKPYPSPL